MEFNEEKPIFLQLADRLEEGILSGAYPEESQVPSITEYSVTYKINPATALKGINLLVDAGLLYKKRESGCLWRPARGKSCADSVKSAFLKILCRAWCTRPVNWGWRKRI